VLIRREGLARRRSSHAARHRAMVSCFTLITMTAFFQYYYQGGLLAQGIPVPVDELKLQMLAVPYQRVWLLLSSEQFGDAQEAAQRWFDTHYHLLQTRALGRLRLRLYGAGTP
jgi:hypothetical protein